MPFQSAIFPLQGFGVPGELYQNAPHIALSYTLRSGAQSNIIGSTAYTITSQGVAQAGAGGLLGFAGYLIAPKTYALYGVPGDTLAPSLELPNETQAELLTTGMLIVTLPAAAEIGDYVIFDDVTGAVATMVPGDTLPAGFSFGNAVVSQYTQSTVGAGLAVIQVGFIVNPVPVAAP